MTTMRANACIECLRITASDTLARESEETDAGSDPIWVQACIGLTFELGLAILTV